MLPGADVDASATLTGGSTIGRDVVVGAGATVDGSVVFDGAQNRRRAPSVTRSIVGVGATIGAGAVLTDAVIGDGAVIGDRCELLAGIRVFPGVVLPDGRGAVLGGELTVRIAVRWLIRLTLRRGDQMI